MSRAAVLVTVLLFAAACGRTTSERCANSGLCVDCTSTCERLLQCRVGFGQDHTLPGPRDDQSRCVRGCLTSDIITPQRQQCILDTDPGDVEKCHRDVLGCLGVEDAGTR
ncbi:MAG: hypothetical protein HY904_11810 [Deltaproteobacteria bacterium]|nr:hypothetical protein [Deltaproteobacteria bacterium]